MNNPQYVAVAALGISLVLIVVLSAVISIFDAVIPPYYSELGSVIGGALAGVLIQQRVKRTNGGSKP